MYTTLLCKFKPYFNQLWIVAAPIIFNECIRTGDLGSTWDLVSTGGWNNIHPISYKMTIKKQLTIILIYEPIWAKIITYASIIIYIHFPSKYRNLTTQTDEFYMKANIHTYTLATKCVRTTNDLWLPRKQDAAYSVFETTSAFSLWTILDFVNTLQQANIGKILQISLTTAQLYPQLIKYINYYTTKLL